MINYHHLEAGYLLQQLLLVVSSVGFTHGLGFVVRLGIFGIIFILVWLIVRKALQFKRTLKEDYALLELTPPAFTEKESYTTQQLFQLIHALGSQRSFIERLLGYTPSVSLEIASTLDMGIRYLVRVPSEEANTLRKSLLSYMPQLIIKTVDEYLHQEQLGSQAKVMEFKLSHHFAFPLKKHESLEKHDPIAYITGMMTKLSPGELVSVQMILTPTKSREARRLSNVILYNGNLIEELDRHSGFLSPFLGSAIKILYQLFSIPFLLITELMAEGNTHRPVAKQPRLERIKTPYEEEVIAAVHEKINQPLFETTIRLLLVVNDTFSKTERTQGFLSSLATFSTHGKQSIIPIRYPSLLRNYINSAFLKRLPGIFQHSLLSVSEISDIYHFPYTDITKTEGLVKSKSRELPAPLSIRKSDKIFDVVIGVNQYGGELVPIGITLEQRLKHMYIIGKTGMGKTTLLTSSIFQDMVNGKGLAMFDPHGDMFQELLAIIPENRRKDVVVFDPSDRDYPIGLNLLSPGIKFSNQEDEHDWIASSVIAVFKKLADEQYWGPRMEHILRNACLTALLTPNPNLYTLQRLLTDKAYQKKIASTLRDPVLRQFWQKEFALMGNMQVSAVTAPLTQRLGSFISSKMSRHILLQEKSTISISQIMDEGKILLVNLSKGDLGEDQSFFFGTILTSFIWMAAYQRTKIPESQRKDFFLYVDEFQNFATHRFSEITSEGRKFHVSLIASHQNIAQVKDQDILKVVAGNANTIVCLKASPDDEAFILPFMDPEVSKGDIVNLAPFNFFMKVTGGESEDAFSGKTVPIDVRSSEQTKDEIIDFTRIHYATPRIEVEHYLETLFAPDTKRTTKAKKPQASTTSRQPSEEIKNTTNGIVKIGV